jgi:hypothetical protein
VAVDFCAELPRPILSIMTYETSPFAFRVEADPQRQDRYLWAIGYGPQTYRRSPQSFATRREAKNDALKLCRRWRHIGGASVTRRLRRDGREAEKRRRMTPAQMPRRASAHRMVARRIFCRIEGREGDHCKF